MTQLLEDRRPSAAHVLSSLWKTGHRYATSWVRRWGLALLVPVVLGIFLLAFNFSLYQNGYYTLFDLGLSYRLAHLFAVNHTLVNVAYPPYVTGIPFSKLFYIPVGITLWFNDSPYTVLVDQTIAIVLGGAVLFRISRLRGLNSLQSFLIQGSYFLYPTTYSYMTHGGNYLVYLPPLLFVSYYLLLRNRPGLSACAAGLAAITNFVAPVIVLLFYAAVFISPRLPRLTPSKIRVALTRPAATAASMFSRARQAIDHNVPYVVFCVFAFNLVLFNISLYGFSGLVFGSLSHGAGSQSQLIASGTWQYLPTKLGFINAALYPVLYFSLLSILSLPVLFYFGVILLATNYIPYTQLFQQYSNLILASVFTSTVDSSLKLRNGGLRSSNLTKILAILMIVGFISLTQNSYVFSGQNLVDGTIIQETQYTAAERLFNLEYSKIPVDTSVWIQNDMPQLMNRKTVYWEPNYDNQSVEFAVINPVGFNPVAAAYSGFDLYWSNHFAMNASYGVYESVFGAIVYKLGYSGSPTFFVPVSLNGSIGTSFLAGQPIPGQNLGGSPLLLLSPGNYTLQFQVDSNSTAMPSMIGNMTIKSFNGAGSLLTSAGWGQFSYILSAGRYFLSLPISTSAYTYVSYALFSSQSQSTANVTVLNYSASELNA